MRVAVIGAGISGNLVARLLCDEYEVHVFEAGNYAGGHANTVDVELSGRPYSVDTGFMVFNERTYPNFCRMLDLLCVEAQDSDMSFSVRCERTGLEYKGGGTLSELFAQRLNLVRPSFWGMLWDILRFYREAPRHLDEAGRELTLGDYLLEHRYGRTFIDKHLVPMAAAIWSAPPRRVMDFPAYFLIRFFRNHGFLQLRDQPQWKTVVGRSRNYVRRLLEPLGDRVRLNCPVESVARHQDHVVVIPRGGAAEVFDRVVFATHADQTLAMLTDANRREREILRSLPYQSNEAVLHTDSRLLPKRRRAWASWNYHIPVEAGQPVAVTYDLSRLQRIDSPTPILLTLNHTEPIDPAAILRRFTYDHPAYECRSIAAQSRLAEINGKRRSYFCGAYWGNGFHEDGVNSALAVARLFGKSLDTWKAASTKDEFDTVATLR